MGMSPAEAAASVQLTGLTDKDMGAVLGIGPRTIRLYRSGDSDPSVGFQHDRASVPVLHDADAARLAPAALVGEVIAIPMVGGTRPRSRWVGGAACVLDRVPGSMVEWHAPGRADG